MPGTNIPVIIDSDALIGLVNPNDPHHLKCVEIQTHLAKNNFETIAPYPIILEATTALARDTKINRPDLAAEILASDAQIEDSPKLDENIGSLVSESFSKNTSRKNTPFDHYVLALAKKNHIKYIFSFDSFYKKQGLNLAEELLKK